MKDIGFYAEHSDDPPKADLDIGRNPRHRLPFHRPAKDGTKRGD